MRRDTTFALIIILAGLFAGPLLGGLLGEAIGRRVAFLTSGALLAATGLISLTIRWNAGQDETAHVDQSGVRTGAVSLDPAAAAGIAIGALALVWTPMSIGFDDYFVGGLLIAAAGAGFACGRILPWRSAAVLAPLGLAVVSFAPPTLSGTPSVLLMFAAAWLTGAGSGTLLRLSLDRGRHLLPSLALGSCLGAASVGIAGAVPGRVTLIPAVAQPKRTASAGLSPRASAAAKPPLKASPAPVVAPSRIHI